MALGFLDAVLAQKIVESVGIRVAALEKSGENPYFFRHGGEIFSVCFDGDPAAFGPSDVGDDHAFSDSGATSTSTLAEAIGRGTGGFAFLSVGS